MAEYFNWLQSPLLLLMRLYWGFGFVMAGKAKLFNLERTAGFFSDLGIPQAMASAVMVGSVECFGGLLLLIGLFSRLACIPLMITMGVALAVVHKTSVIEMSKEDPFLFLLTCLIVMAFGAGKISLDFILKKKYCEGPL